jgi:type II secretory ATPase GspE/PulE/Tfp pilus assembly ATPase PilB-like protein
MTRAQEADLKKVALAEGMETLRADGVNKALAGLTTLDEVFKLTILD